MLKIHTSISRQAALSRVIWSAMVKLVKPGNRFANSTILIMHFVASSLNLSQSPRSSRTRWSALEFWKDRQRYHKSTTSLSVSGFQGKETTATFSFQKYFLLTFQAFSAACCWDDAAFKLGLIAWKFLGYFSVTYDCRGHLYKEYKWT